MKVVALLLSILLLVGCNESANVSDLKSFTENAFKDHVPEVEPLPALQPQAVFIYTASGLADPFDTENLKEKQASLPIGEGEDGPDQTRRKEPLEAFPLDSLKLVGVMEQNGANWAVVRAPDQSVHRVAQGNYMGVNFGEILVVLDNSIEVRELVRNPVGRWEKKDVTLILVE